MISLITATSVYPRSPQKAVLYSLLIPGGGQFYTKRYLRGIIIAVGEIGLGYNAYINHREGDSDKRDQYLYYLAYLIGFSMADAYVGALVYNFDLQMDKERLKLGMRLRW
ncbi:hypothetical protein DRP53_06620 [candidate division WOR-3 bacterium]|uniref:DUF5683 domain-containing protein n=1 Tax=candidate division WOR-3 bacterium TaxID=2052148 RepID=A0A660SGH5_UNCW3|nr:MAG: hypothetical protein DRP53_06620 [candidate division WOR-3 bacterium]